MGDRLRFYIRRIRERLWVRPLTMGVLSVAVVFLAKMADTGVIGRHLPLVTQASVETLLAIISASMLVIATFAVASMVAAYASASSTATPRSFSLIIADDISQNALSTFIGAFIFSIVALIALKNGYYDRAGRFALFVITVLILAMVILTFVRWVDCIARLGRLTSTVEKVEAVTAAALQRRRRTPHLRGTPADGTQYRGQAVYGKSIGYVQRIEITALQAYAEKTGLRIQVAALPGAFSAPGRALAYITVDQSARVDFDQAPIAQAFVIGVHREFDEDPRFGLAVPEIAVRDMFDDAFTAIARDGAGTIEVAGRLQKAFASLATLDDAAMREAATQHSRLALARSEGALVLADDLEAIRRLATFALSVQPGVAKR